MALLQVTQERAGPSLALRCQLGNQKLSCHLLMGQKGTGIHSESMWHLPTAFNVPALLQGPKRSERAILSRMVEGGWFPHRGLTDLAFD